MKERSFIAAGIFLTIALFLAGIILGQMFTSVTVRAERESRMPDETKWEYCSVVPLNYRVDEIGGPSGAVMIYYARGASDTSEKVEGTIKNGLIDSLIAPAVAKLGAEGWEMVGQGTFLSYQQGEAATLYFKRQVGGRRAGQSGQ